MNLRTFDKYNKIDFQCFNKQTNVDLLYQNIGFDLSSNNTFIILENLLSLAECDEILVNTDNYYGDLELEYLEKDRDSKRILNLNQQMADRIYQRLEHIVEEEHNNKNLKPFGFGIDGKWNPCGLNYCFRHSKYNAPSVGFKPHRDSSYIENEDLRSVLTLLIYLNDNFVGGNTIFLKPNTTREIGQIVNEELSIGHTILYNYKPIKGSAILFNHDIIHCGESVTNGTKYIIRTDVIFKRIEKNMVNNSWRKNKYFLQAIEYYREANNQEMRGNVELAGELYERGLSLRQFH